MLLSDLDLQNAFESGDGSITTTAGKNLVFNGTSISNAFVLDEDTGNIGINTPSPTSKCHIIGDSLTSFTGNTPSGILSIEHSSASVNQFAAIDFRADAFNTNDRPMARIAMEGTSSGSYLLLGTSKSYSAGITNSAIVIDPNGDVTVDGDVNLSTGNTYRINGVDVVGAGGSKYSVQFTYNDNTTVIANGEYFYFQVVSNQRSGTNGGIVNGDFSPYKPHCAGTITSICAYMGKGRSQNNVTTGQEVGAGFRIRHHTYDQVQNLISIDARFNTKENINAGQSGKVDNSYTQVLSESVAVGDFFSLEWDDNSTSATNKLSGANNVLITLEFTPS